MAQALHASPRPPVAWPPQVFPSNVGAPSAHKSDDAKTQVPPGAQHVMLQDAAQAPLQHTGNWLPPTVHCALSVHGSPSELFTLPKRLIPAV